MRRTTIYLPNDVVEYVKKNNLCLSEEVRNFFQYQQKGIYFLRKSLENLEKRQEIIQNNIKELRHNIKAQHNELHQFWHNLDIKSKQYVAQTREGVEGKRFEMYGRWKRFTKDYTNIQYGFFQDLVNELPQIINNINEDPQAKTRRSAVGAMVGEQ